MQKVEIWGAVKVGNRVYRDNEILQLIGKPIAPWKFADDLPNDECNICLGFGEEKRVKLGAKMQRPRAVILLILDGWGWREETADNTVRLAHTPTFDNLWDTCPHALLHASGADVGLPKGQMGTPKSATLTSAPAGSSKATCFASAKPSPTGQ